MIISPSLQSNNWIDAIDAIMMQSSAYNSIPLAKDVSRSFPAIFLQRKFDFFC